MPEADFPPVGSFLRLSARQFASVRQLAYETCGLDLGAGKEALVATRLGKRMRESGYGSFDEYYRHVVEDPTGEALIKLIDALTTNYTSFFREPDHFDFFRAHILPQWTDRRTIEIWSAACSTGEEPYSIAMCLLEELGSLPPGKARILATDISTQALAKAERAVYEADRLGGVSNAQLRNYWLRGERDWEGWCRLKKEVRTLVEFRRLNLLEAQLAAGAFPLIFCRNVMIYFDRPTQEGVVNRLTQCLEPGGYLFIGHAESLNGIRHTLQYIAPAIYRKTTSLSRRKTG